MQKPIVSLQGRMYSDIHTYECNLDEKKKKKTWKLVKLIAPAGRCIWYRMQRGALRASAVARETSRVIFSGGRKIRGLARLFPSSLFFLRLNDLSHAVARVFWGSSLKRLFPVIYALGIFFSFLSLNYSIQEVFRFFFIFGEFESAVPFWD